MKTAKSPPATTTSAPAAEAPRPEPAVDSTLQAKAEEQLRLAGVYRTAGLAEKAEAILRKIIKEFPKTAAAAKARKQLAENP
jgi:thioredoxin-like negative regulator of GroEL